jgi:hypothetical protein
MTALETHAHLRAENRIRIGWNPHFDAPPTPIPPGRRASRFNLNPAVGTVRQSPNSLLS